MNIFITVLITSLVFIIISLISKIGRLSIVNKQQDKKQAETDIIVTTYFNLVLQYRDILVQNNLDLPTQPIGTQLDKGVNGGMDVDEILDEIAEKGIENVSPTKLEFLKNNTNG